MALSKTVIPECYVDSCLFNVMLKFGKEGVNHTKGNSTVVKKVVEKFDDLFCIAIIDKDRKDIDFIKDACELIEMGETDTWFKLFKRKEKHHYFIQIVPAIEEWIIRVAKELNYDLNSSQIKCADIKDLKRISKSTTSKYDKRFVDLFQDLLSISKEKSFEPLLKMKRLITHILDKNYQVEVNTLNEI